MHDKYSYLHLIKTEKPAEGSLCLLTKSLLLWRCGAEDVRIEHSSERINVYGQSFQPLIYR